MSNHLVIAPIVTPLLVAALQLLVGEKRRRAVLALSIASCVVLVLLAAALMQAVSADGALATVYRIGDWPARFGIVLVADRLSALMVLLTGVLALAVLPYALSRWQHRGGHFQPLLQFLLMGLNGAFLTGDLFNLFVFFEVLLAASYGLALHGSGVRRVSAGLHYIAVNLTASMLFLLGVSLIFGVTGTLNMAALAELIPHVPERTRALLHAGAAILGVAFLIKTAMWPLGFWLPRTYAAASPAVAAMFALMTKVGIYVLLRLGLLLFGDGAGPASAHFGSDWMLWGGVATVAAGTVGMLGARDLAKLAGYNVLISSGTLLGAIGLQQPAVTVGALAYLVISTLAIAAFFLLAGLLASDGDDDTDDTLSLEPYEQPGETAANESLYAQEDESRVVISAPIAMLGASFLACALLLAGLPPLSGFLAKFAMLAPMLEAGERPGALVLFTLVIVAGFGTVIAMCRAGMQIFWVEPERLFPTVRLSETVSILALLGLCLLLTVVVEAPLRYLRDTARQIHTPAAYIRQVLPAAEAPP
ncbi:monovalent cation/H+ antiporter subunit D [Rhodanobacter denitrificans]|uniref:Monovalent cation/H+ antiporter subunit D n=1 Tax=Rhodanobacter denitrificans TaxID=666685 RepID=A0A368K9L0_9GAMM|nr:monovalent cation/H+ antiporter subunit D [Rhodanobacter denitrificans]RCS28622.1 monovalent cation/H+ antiporter subunit D [Rhodanobacter denitrificans]